MKACLDHMTPAQRLAPFTRLACAMRDLAALRKPRPEPELEVPWFLKKQAD